MKNKNNDDNHTHPIEEGAFESKSARCVLHDHITVKKRKNAEKSKNLMEVKAILLQKRKRKRKRKMDSINGMLMNISFYIIYSCR